MTMHKSKGLQFDHVLLHGLGRYPRPSSPSVMSWFDLPDAHGGEEKIISPVGRRDELDRDPVHRFIDKTRAAKDAHEKGRLLYVACTRARKSLHLVGNADVSKDGESIRKPPSNTLLSLLWPAVEPSYLKAFESFEAPPVLGGESSWMQPVLRRFASPWNLPDVPPVPGQTQFADDEEGGSYKVDYDWVGAEARLAGTVVHRWLQRATDGRVTLEIGALPKLRATSRRWLRELGAGGDTIEAICDRIEMSLDGVLNDEKGRWLLHGDGAAELPLSGSVNGKIQAIVIDRVRIDDDGTHWIVDYKTSTHEGGKLQAFLQSECERYRGQLQKYARIYGAFSGVSPRCALYFPMLREWVEVDV